jgi:hypothetical protein
MPFRPSDLEAYLDEALPAEEMVRLEKAVRSDRALARQLAAIHARRDSGAHSLGEIWRSRRLSCPTREQLGHYATGALTGAFADYIAFHLSVIGCRCCQANLADLESRRGDTEETARDRRGKFFRSSAGYLKE